MRLAGRLHGPGRLEPDRGLRQRAEQTHAADAPDGHQVEGDVLDEAGGEERRGGVRAAPSATSLSRAASAV